MIASRRAILGMLFLAVLTALAIETYAQPVQNAVSIVVAPERPGWVYKPGEKVTFTVEVRHYSEPIDGMEVRYEIREEKMDARTKGTLKLKNGVATVDGGTMKNPGFLRCWVYAEVEGRKYDGCGTAGFDPLAIKPTTESPADFDTFWNDGKAALAKIPLDAIMTLIPEKCTETYDVYHVNLKSYGNSRLYGILCTPKKPGRYPAALRVPGAGIRPYNGFTDLAGKGIITFEIGIHGIPVNLDPNVYTSLSAGALNGYQLFNLDDREKYYYRRVYLGCVRAVDFIFSLPQFDGENLAVTGGSQGGALSIVTAALDSRVKWIGVYCPALCDVTGYLHGRAGGWPHMFAPGNADFCKKEEKINTSKYYDVVNFARRVHVPGYFSWGFNDTTCPPTSMYSAYNVIDAPKELYLVSDARHWIYAEQSSNTMAWLESKLKGN